MDALFLESPYSEVRNKLCFFAAQHSACARAAQCREDCECKAQRKVCVCAAACRCGRWNLRSTTRLAYNGCGLCRETLRWESWDAESNSFKAGAYIMHAYYFKRDAQAPEGSPDPALFDAWCKAVAWHRDPAVPGAKVRLAFCQVKKEGGTKLRNPKRTRGEELWGPPERHPVGRCLGPDGSYLSPWQQRTPSSLALDPDTPLPPAYSLPRSAVPLEPQHQQGQLQQSTSTRHEQPLQNRGLRWQELRVPSQVKAENLRIQLRTPSPAEMEFPVVSAGVSQLPGVFPHMTLQGEPKASGAPAPAAPTVFSAGSTLGSARGRASTGGNRPSLEERLRKVWLGSSKGSLPGSKAGCPPPSVGHQCWVRPGVGQQPQPKHSLQACGGGHVDQCQCQQQRQALQPCCNKGGQTWHPGLPCPTCLPSVSFGQSAPGLQARTQLQASVTTPFSGRFGAGQYSAQAYQRHDLLTQVVSDEGTSGSSQQGQGVLGIPSLGPDWQGGGVGGEGNWEGGEQLQRHQPQDQLQGQLQVCAVQGLSGVVEKDVEMLDFSVSGSTAVSASGSLTGPEVSTHGSWQEGTPKDAAGGLMDSGVDSSCGHVKFSLEEDLAYVDEWFEKHPEEATGSPTSSIGGPAALVGTSGRSDAWSELSELFADAEPGTVALIAELAAVDADLSLDHCEGAGPAGPSTSPWPIVDSVEDAGAADLLSELEAVDLDMDGIEGKPDLGMGAEAYTFCEDLDPCAGALRSDLAAADAGRDVCMVDPRREEPPPEAAVPCSAALFGELAAVAEHLCEAPCWISSEAACGRELCGGSSQGLELDEHVFGSKLEWHSS